MNQFYTLNHQQTQSDSTDVATSAMNLHTPNATDKHFASLHNSFMN